MAIPSTLDLAQKLIQAQSITPEDHGCQQLLHDPLVAMGFTIHPLTFGNVSNFYARLGTLGKNFCFAGHTDVVASGDPTLWHSDPFAAHVNNGMLIGRGASDMKGSLASMITSVNRFLNHHPDFTKHNSLSFLITGDEEGDAIHGTVKVLEWLKQQNETLDYCLVGEPTSILSLGDTLKNGRRGSLNGKLTLRGERGHVAYPHLADNPIHSIGPILERLTALHFDEGNDHFPATSLQFTNLHSGDGSSNVIPGTLTATFNIRFSPESTSEGCEKQIRHILDHIQPKPNYTLTTQLSGQPFLTKDGPLLKALTKSVHHVTGITPKPSTGGGTSDARFISQVCSETLEFGLVGATMHQVNEHIPVQDLEQLSLVYEKLLHTLF